MSCIKIENFIIYVIRNSVIKNYSFEKILFFHLKMYILYYYILLHVYNILQINSLDINRNHSQPSILNNNKLIYFIKYYSTSFNTI
jgi:hypothetical protein